MRLLFSAPLPSDDDKQLRHNGREELPAVSNTETYLRSSSVSLNPKRELYTVTRFLSIKISLCVDAGIYCIITAGYVTLSSTHLCCNSYLFLFLNKKKINNRYRAGSASIKFLTGRIPAWVSFFLSTIREPSRRKGADTDINHRARSVNK